MGEFNYREYVHNTLLSKEKTQFGLMASDLLLIYAEWLCAGVPEIKPQTRGLPAAGPDSGNAARVGKVQSI